MGLCLAGRRFEIRVQGEIFGTVNLGFQEFEVAVGKNYPILEEARRVASQISHTPDWREQIGICSHFI